MFKDKANHKDESYYILREFKEFKDNPCRLKRG